MRKTTEVTNTINDPAIKALMGANSREWMKAQFEEAARPDLSTLLFKLRESCRKREAAFKSVGYLTPDEKQWTSGILQELEETAARVKAMLAASPEMAKPEEVLKVKTQYLRNKFNRRQSGMQ